SVLGPREVAGLLHEAAKLRHRHRVAVDPEAVDRDLAYRPLLPVERLGAHAERAAGQLDHVPEHGRAARVARHGQSRAKAILASSARSTNGSPLTSMTALWMVPPTNSHGDSPG